MSSSWLQDAQLALGIATRYNLVVQRNEIANRIADGRLGLLVVLVGEGKFGKSSLLNALTGRNYAEVDVLPRTRRVDIHTGSNADDVVIVRTTSRLDGFEATVAQARELCRADEKRTRAQQEVVETVTFHRDFLLGSSIGIVDTQGLDQSLYGDEAIEKSLVTGLENTHQVVKEPWVDWYNRADVVLWCVPAEKLQSKPTHEYLSRLRRLYKKSIVPVLTKCDTIAGRNEKAIALFHQLFSTTLGDACPFLTSCNPKADPSTWLGINELREHLLSLAGDASRRKEVSARQALADATRNMVSLVLLPAASNQVANLRAIASVADRVAGQVLDDYMKVVREIAAIRGVYMSRVEGLRSLLPALDEELKSQWKTMKKWHQLAPSAEHKQRLQDLAESKISNHLRSEQIVDSLREGLTHLGRGLPDLARRCAQDPALALRQVAIDPSGITWHDAFELNLVSHKTLRSPQAPHIAVPRISLPNALSNLWDGIIKLFGKSTSRTHLYADELAYIAAVTHGMESYLDKCLRSAKRRVSNVARDVKAAVAREYIRCSKRTVNELIEKTSQLDGDLKSIAVISGLKVQVRYDLQARYWTTDNYDVDLLREVATDVVLFRGSALRESIGADLPEGLAATQWKVEGAPMDWTERGPDTEAGVPRLVLKADTHAKALAPQVESAAARIMSIWSSMQELDAQVEAEIPGFSAQTSVATALTAEFAGAIAREWQERFPLRIGFAQPATVGRVLGMCLWRRARLAYLLTCVVGAALVGGILGHPVEALSMGLTAAVIAVALSRHIAQRVIHREALVELISQARNIAHVAARAMSEEFDSVVKNTITKIARNAAPRALQKALAVAKGSDENGDDE